MSLELLYLEDDEVLASVTIKALSKRGFNTRHFLRVDDVMQAEGLALFNYAILDLKLEDGHSIPLIEPLLKQNPKMKILVLTGYASIATAVKAVKLGACNYLAKPATVDQILAAFDGASKQEIEEPEPIAQPSIKRMEWEHIQRALEENNGNISATARQLKMHRRTLQRKLQKRPVSD